MSGRHTHAANTLRTRLSNWVSGPQILAFAPALCLGAFWIGGEISLVAASVAIPILVVLLNPSALRIDQSRTPANGLVARKVFEDLVESTFETAKNEGQHSSIFVLDLDDYDTLVERHGHAAAELVAARIGDRFDNVLRNSDIVAQLGEHRFAVCLEGVRNLDLESCIQMAGRFQTAVEDPVSLDGTTVYMTTSVGFCLLSRAPGATGKSWFEAAELALSEARSRGPSTIRAFSKEIQRTKTARVELREHAREALENGEVQPWYQPQLSTDTGKISGFEALARWVHPQRGLISPPEFLPAFEEAGLLDRLGEVMLYHALTALKAWDAAGHTVPSVGVNFSGSELNNPRLADKVKWEMDRFDLAPERMCVEILETVVCSSPGDAVARNIKALSALGCKIDLDDFGTGNASIAAIKRFDVNRIKIDRSFVMKVDRDPEQQRMIGAILTMAERLDIETVAEGVETVGEHALLAQLGCNHVQGFGIGRPMPFEQTIEWLGQHQSKLNETPMLPPRDASEG